MKAIALLWICGGIGTLAQSTGLDPALQLYLRLSPQQAEQIGAWKSASVNATRDRTGRINDLQRKLMASMSDEVLDAQSMGGYWAEALTLQATELTERRATAAEIRKLLTPEQIAALDALTSASALASVASAAACEGLVPSAPPQPIVQLLIPQNCVSTGIESYLRNFSTYVTLRPPNLPAFLALTTEQNAALSAINKSYGSRFEDLAIALFSEVVYLSVAERKGPPFDALDIGQRLVKMESLRREIRNLSAKVVAERQGVLTEDQLVKLRKLEEARQLIRMEEEARCFAGLLPHLAYPVANGLYSATAAHPFADSAFRDCTSSGVRLAPEE